MRGWMLLLATFATACGHYTAKATVTVAVSGPGAVRSPALQGDCRGTCWFSVPRDTPVHLEPVIEGEATFAGWSGACSGTAACDLAPGVDVSVAATFMAGQPRRLQVSLNGAGTVRSDPAGTATPAAGFSFNGFAGACSGTSCPLRLSTSARVVAAFQAIPAFKVVVVPGGDGHGRVASAPAGIDCPGTCTATFAEGTALTLSAAPDALSRFVRYEGSCSGGQCALALRGDAAISVEFAQRRYLATDLGAPAGGWWSDAIGISPHGTLVAGAWGGVQQIFFWDGSMHDIGIATGNPSGVNEAGTVVGTALVANQWHAFRWDSGKTSDLASLGGAISWATGVNRAGVVVGWSARGDGVVRATSWTAKGPVDLGSLGDPWNGCSYAHAMVAVNGAGVAVGYVFDSGGPQRGVVYAAGRMLDLNTLVDGTLYTITMATGIDEAGNIVVQAQDRGYRRALLLRPQ